jgi:hypothetical protein
MEAFWYFWVRKECKADVMDEQLVLAITHPPIGSGPRIYIGAVGEAVSHQPLYSRKAMEKLLENNIHPDEGGQGLDFREGGDNQLETVVGKSTK